MIDSRVAELERQNAELRRQLDARTAELEAALAWQTATAEILPVINSSPGDLAAVFDAILEKARTLCEAPLGALFLAESDELFRAVAMRGGTEAWHDRIRRGSKPRRSNSAKVSGMPCSATARNCAPSRTSKPP